MADTKVLASLERRTGIRLSWVLGQSARVLVVLVPLIHLALFAAVQLPRTDAQRDLVAYYQAAGRIEGGRSMYEPYPVAGPHDPGPQGPVYLYPPVLAPALALLPHVPYATFARTWLIFLYICFWLYAAVLARLASGSWSWRAVLAGGTILICFPGTHRALALGQVDVLLWALSGLAVGYPAWGTFGLGLVCAVKPYAVVPEGALLARRPRAGAAGLLAAVALGLAVGVGALGWPGFLHASGEWLHYVLPSVSQGQIAHLHGPDGSSWLPIGNLSLTAAPLLVAGALGWHPRGDLPGWIRVYLGIASVAVPLAVAWFCRRRSVSLQTAAVLAASLLAAPIFRDTYAASLLLLPAAILAERRMRRAAAAAPAGAGAPTARHEEANG